MMPSGPPDWLIAMDNEEKVRMMMTRAMNETVVMDGDKTPDWAEKAVRFMARLMDRAGKMDEFAHAVLSGDARTKCCVARNEKLPGGHGRANVFILRLFRFPWLRVSLSLQSTRTCRNKYEPYAKNACMNPYHYTVQELPRQPIKGIVVDKEGDYGEPPHRLNDGGFWKEELHAGLLMIGGQPGAGHGRQATDYMEDLSQMVPPNVTMQGDEIKVMYEEMAKSEGRIDPSQMAGTELAGQGFVRWTREVPRQFNEGDADEEEDGLLTPPDQKTSSTETLVPEPESPTSTIVGSPASAPPSNFHYQSGLSSPASDIGFSPQMYRVGAAGPVPVLEDGVKKREPSEELAEEEPMEQDAPPSLGQQFQLQQLPTPQQQQQQQQQMMMMQQFPQYYQTLPQMPMFQPHNFFQSSSDQTYYARAQLARTVEAAYREQNAVKHEEVLGEPDRIEYDTLLAHADAEPDGEGQVGKDLKYANGRPMTPVEPRPLYRNSPAELAQLSANAREQSELARKAFDCVEYKENPHWLTITYHEESQAVGDVMRVELPQVLIDGYLSPAFKQCGISTRYSLGWINNPKQRSLEVQHCRGIIGKGIRLYLLSGDLFVENLSQVPIFTQSICANMKNGFELNTVSKLPPYSTMKAFDLKVFSEKLAHAASRKYSDVYALTRLCEIRISFVKGWGEHYRRSTILKSPIWLHLHMHNPYAWAEAVLKCMGCPDPECGSRT